jgi:hypothetical protein
MTFNEGTLFITNMRVFWAQGSIGADSFSQWDGEDDTSLFADAVRSPGADVVRSPGAGLAAAIVNKKWAGKVLVNVPLSNIASVEEYNKGIIVGAILTAKSGESYVFHGDTQALLYLLTPCVSG